MCSLGEAPRCGFPISSFLTHIRIIRWLNYHKVDALLVVWVERPVFLSVVAMRKSNDNDGVMMVCYAVEPASG